MKILAVAPNYWPAFIHGGPVFSLHYLNKALVRKGIYVTVYTTNVDIDAEVPANKEVEVDGVKITYFTFTKLFDFIAKHGWQLSWRLSRALKNNLQTFDLIYISTVWNYSTIAASYYSRCYKKPYVIAPRGMLYPETFYKKIWKKWLYYRFALAGALKHAAAIHYTCEDEANKTQAFLSLKNLPIIIPNGVELPKLCSPPDKGGLTIRYPYLKDKKVILFLGRINWKKGLDILIEGFAKLFRDRQDVHLLIAGSDEEGYATRVKKWIRNYRIDSGVTFTGILNGKDKLEAYSKSDIFVLPSYSENFGLSVVEAMALGLPVVISNKVGISKEIAINKAGIVVDTNAGSLYRGMKLLLEDTHLKEATIINGKKMAEENYSIDKIADKMIEAFENIIKSQNGHSRSK